jgi:hypothetical protein
MYRKHGNLKEILELFFQIFSGYSFQKIIEFATWLFFRVNDGMYVLQECFPIHDICKNALCMLESQLLAIYENIYKKILMHAHARFFSFFFGEWWTFATNRFFSKIWKKCSLDFLNSKIWKRILKWKLLDTNIFS